MNKLAFTVSKRILSKSNINSLRKEGQVAGIIYGEFLKDSIPVQILSSDLKKLLKTNSSGSIIPLNLNGNIKNCVVKDVQKDISGNIIHIDFQYVIDNEVIKMNIPLNYTGQELLHVKRLVLETHLPSLELQGPVELIPEYIKVDVSHMNFNDQLLAKDINIPTGISLLTDPSSILAIINT